MAKAVTISGPGGFSATTEDISALAGGTYTVMVDDDNSVCFASAMFSITDPLPIVYNITTPTPQVVCSIDDVTLDLDNSDNGAQYEIQVNGTNSGFSQTSVGGGPLSVTINLIFHRS